MCVSGIGVRRSKSACEISEKLLDMSFFQSSVTFRPAEAYFLIYLDVFTHLIKINLAEYYFNDFSFEQEIHFYCQICKKKRNILSNNSLLGRVFMQRLHYKMGFRWNLRKFCIHITCCVTSPREGSCVFTCNRFWRICPRRVYRLQYVAEIFN